MNDKHNDMDFDCLCILKYKEKRELRKMDMGEETASKLYELICEYQTDFDILKEVEYQSTYSAEKDEVCKIDNYELPEYLVDCFKNTINIPTLDFNNKEEINSIIGVVFNNHDKLIFQRLKISNILTKEKHRLIAKNGTMVLSEENEISLKDKIDCTYSNLKLLFRSKDTCLAILPNLAEYYRLATDEEISIFLEDTHITVKDTEAFSNNMKDSIRKFIHIISEEKILENNKPEKIKQIAKENKIDINIDNNRIVIPTDKKEMEIVLGFLANHVFKQPLGINTVICNSMRPI